MEFQLITKCTLHYNTSPTIKRDTFLEVKIHGHSLTLVPCSTFLEHFYLTHTYAMVSVAHSPLYQCQNISMDYIALSNKTP